MLIETYNKLFGLSLLSQTQILNDFRNRGMKEKDKFCGWISDNTQKLSQDEFNLARSLMAERLNLLEARKGIV